MKSRISTGKISSSNSNGLPVKLTLIQERRNSLKRYAQTQEKRRNSELPINHDKQQPSTKLFASNGLRYEETRATFRKNLRIDATASSHNLRRRIVYNNIEPEHQTTPRPFTVSVGSAKHSQRKRFDDSPLDIINTHHEDYQDRRLKKNRSESRKYHGNFLKKGTSVNKNIILNILKSKFNQKISGSALSYTNVKQNENIASLLLSQVPKTLNDVIGAEQMMRMSHIFAGGHFKSTNMTNKLNNALIEFQKRKKTVQNVQNQEDRQDNLTLKSIKRW